MKYLGIYYYVINTADRIITTHVMWKSNIRYKLYNYYIYNNIWFYIREETEYYGLAS